LSTLQSKMAKQKREIKKEAINSATSKKKKSALQTDVELDNVANMAKTSGLDLGLGSWD